MLSSKEPKNIFNVCGALYAAAAIGLGIAAVVILRHTVKFWEAGQAIAGGILFGVGALGFAGSSIISFKNAGREKKCEEAGETYKDPMKNNLDQRNALNELITEKTNEYDESDENAEADLEKVQENAAASVEQNNGTMAPMPSTTGGNGGGNPGGGGNSGGGGNPGGGQA